MPNLIQSQKDKMPHTVPSFVNKSISNVDESS